MFPLLKTLRPTLIALVVCAILCGTTAQLYADDKKPSLYIAVFRLTVGEDDILQDFQVIKVIDLLSGSNNAASIELPQEFINQARKKVEDEHIKPTIRDGKPTSTLTTFIYSPTDEKQEPPGITFSAFNGAMNTTSEFLLLGQNAGVSAFGANFGRSACFVSYYAMPLPKTSKDQREAIIEAEIQRSAANVPNAEILSRENLSTDSQTIMEVTCKSSNNKALTIHSRYICNEHQMLAFTAVTTDGLSDEDIQPLDRLFKAFRFP